MNFFNEIYKSQKRIINLSSHYITEAALDKSVINIFLSHSSNDKDVLKDVISFLETFDNVKVYIDKKDGDLPKVTSPQTAKILKKRISECQKFIVLITDNTPKSRWIPWELGLADAIRTRRNIALLPYSRTTNDFITTQEYLGLYDKIIYNKVKNEQNPKWLVKFSHPIEGNGTVVSLTKWLKQNFVTIND